VQQPRNCSFKQIDIDPRLRMCATLSVRRLLAVWLGLLLLAFAMRGYAATYYVSTGGNDSAAGTQAQPWRTIQRAVNAANPADVILITTGVYREKVTFFRSGAPGQRIVVKNAPGHFPVIDGIGVSMGQYEALVGLNNVSYVHLEGLEVRNSSAYNVWVGGEAHHLELMNLTVHDGASSGIWLDGPRSRPAMSVIAGNKVYGHNMGGITVWTATGGYYRIENNEVWSNRGRSNYDGIQVGGGSAGSHHVVVKNNVVHDNGEADVGEDPMDLGGHAINHHYLVEGNWLYNSTGSFKLHSGQLKSDWYTPGVSSYHIARFNKFTGIGFVSYEFPNPIAVYNNTFVNCGQCVMFYGEDSSQNQNMGDSTYRGGDAGRMVWKNNLFFNDTASSSYALLQSGPGGTATIDLTYRSVRFQNNMYKLAPGQKIMWNGLYGPPVSAAVFAKYQNSNAPNYPDAGSLLTSALFTTMFRGSGYVSNADYRLAPGAPAIGKGTPVTRATNAGSASTTLVVDRASFFHDGYCVGNECLNTPDTILIGNSAPVAISAVNDATNTITLAAPVTWAVGASVTLAYTGQIPDIGAPAMQYTALPQLISRGAPACPCSIWSSSAVPTKVDASDATAGLELGVRFRSDRSGSITGIRFYKSSANTGTHVGKLWSSTGVLLASATFANESASGWQQVNFATPVTIAAGTTYVASYHTPSSHYSGDVGYFAATGVDNGYLHALKNGLDGANGVYLYGAGGFPTKTFSAANYWVDVVFMPN
jgi:hypothetical protein